MLDSIKRSGQPAIDFGRRCPKMDRQILTPLLGHICDPQIEILMPNTSGRNSETAPAAPRGYAGTWRIRCSCQKLRHENLRREVADASSLTGCHRIVHLAGRRRRSSERVTRQPEVKDSASPGSYASNRRASRCDGHCEQAGRECRQPALDRQSVRASATREAAK